MKTKTYISDKISGLPKSEYKDKFWDAYMYLIRRGDDPQCPIYFKPLFGKKNWFCFMVVCICKLCHCQKILMLDNWKESKGARIEHFIAKLMRIEIEHYTPKEL